MYSEVEQSRVEFSIALRSQAKRSYIQTELS